MAPSNISSIPYSYLNPVSRSFFDESPHIFTASIPFNELHQEHKHPNQYLDQEIQRKLNHKKEKKKKEKKLTLWLVCGTEGILEKET